MDGNNRVLAVLFLFRPGAFQLHNRISRSIGNALSRRVTIDNVRLHALPRPGSISKDWSSMTTRFQRRADDSRAGRFRRDPLSFPAARALEIATLSATEPSINIVRSSDGRWNLASLIERNAQIPAAPTQKAGSERRPAFRIWKPAMRVSISKLGRKKNLMRWLMPTWLFGRIPKIPGERA